MFDIFNNYMSNNRRGSKRFSVTSANNASPPPEPSVSSPRTTLNSAINTASSENNTAMDDIAVYRKDTDYLEHESMMVVHVEENQRYNIINQNWGSEYLLVTDPKRYRSSYGSSDSFPIIPPPENWTFDGDWLIENVQDELDEGWMYNTDFLKIDLGRYTKCNSFSTVRRRKWIRKVIPAINIGDISIDEGYANETQQRQTSDEYRSTTPDETFQHDSSALSSASNPYSSPPKAPQQAQPSSGQKNSPAAAQQQQQQQQEIIPNIPAMDDNFTMEYEDDEPGSIRDTDSTYGDYSETPSTRSSIFSNATNAAPAPATSTKRRSSFFSFGSSSSNNNVQANPPPPSSSPSQNTAPSSSSSASSSAANSVPLSTMINHQQNCDPSIKVYGTTLTAIGKQIKMIEGESKKEDELVQKHWRDVIKPQLERDITRLEKSLIQLKQLLERELHRQPIPGAASTTSNTTAGSTFTGMLQGQQGNTTAATTPAVDPAKEMIDYINKLEDELVSTNEKLDAFKQQLYFPDSPYTFGQGGVYVAMQDYWVEHISGSFALSLLPSNGRLTEYPQIRISVSGTKKNPTGGVTARVKVEGFKLMGDKGKNIPKLKFDVLKITIAFSFSAILQFHTKTNKWILDAKDFTLSIISFKGPYGLNRSIVGLIVSLITPTIRHQIIANLPFELGHFIANFSSQFVVNGEFDLKGMDLNLLSQEWWRNSIFTSMCDYTPIQMEMFYWMQKALERSHGMKTPAELIAYIQMYSKHPHIWKQLVDLWTQATILYCEKVALAKQGGSNNTMSSSMGNTHSSSSLSLPQFKIEFPKFLQLCDNLTNKRISANFKLQYVDGQVSINHLVTFVYEIVRRMFNESIAKATNNIGKLRLQNALEKVFSSYQNALQGLRLMAQNMDFAQLTVQANICGGPNGVVSLTCREIVAQAPLLLALSILKDKNLGVLPLVPYIISFKPQDNGDVYLEMYHFTHSRSDAAFATMNTVPMTTSTTRTASSSSPIPFPHDPTAASTSSEYPGQGSVHSTSFDSTPRHRADTTDSSIYHPQSQQQYQQQQQPNREVGLFCTSYNKLVTKITSGKLKPRTRTLHPNSQNNTNNTSTSSSSDPTGTTAAANRERFTDRLNNQLGNGSQTMITTIGSSSSGSSGGGGKGPLLTTYHPTHPLYTYQHLLVKQDELTKVLEDVLADIPMGEEADTILSVSASNPHISMVVDTSMTFKSGAELFTLALGPKPAGWKPYGAPNMWEESGGTAPPVVSMSGTSAVMDSSNNTHDAAGAGGAGAEMEERPSASSQTGSTTPKGCPILMQTAPGIKLFAQIPKVDVHVNLASLFRFLLAHFVDLSQLTAYLESFFGGECQEEPLIVIKFLLEKISKYLLLPGLYIDVNLNGKLNTVNGEILVRIETPEEILSSAPPTTSMNTTSSSTVASSSSDEPLSAINIQAQISLQQIFQDSKDIDSYLKAISSVEPPNMNNVK